MGQRDTKRGVDRVTGSCVQCGECCKILPMLRRGLRSDTVEWLLARGGKVEGKFILLPQVCQHLKLVMAEDGDMFYICAVHDTPEQPKICKAYHGQKGRWYIPPGCGYLK